MRRLGVVYLLALLGILGQVSLATAEEHLSATPVADLPVSTAGQSQPRVLSDTGLTVHAFQVTCAGTVTVSYTATTDMAVQLSSFISNYGDDDSTSDILPITLHATQTEFSHELGGGYDWYSVALLDTYLPDLAPVAIGNCNSTLSIGSFTVDCHGVTTITYTASGEPPLVWLAIANADRAAEPAYISYELDPAQATFVTPGEPSDVPYSVNAWLEVPTPSGTEILDAQCRPTPDTDPTPTAEPTSTPTPVEVIVQIIIDVIRRVLAGQ